MVFSELLHSNTNLTQITENQLKQTICVCGPRAVSLSKVKYTLSILQTYWKYTSKVYLKYTSSKLEVYFKYTSSYLKHTLSILQVYFKYTSTC